VTRDVMTGADAETDARFQAVSADFRKRLVAAGLTEEAARTNSPETLIDGVWDRLNAQPEFVMTPGQYVQRLVTTARVADAGMHGRALAAELGAIEKTWGVPADVLVAIWGIESNFGREQGDWPVLGVLSALSAMDTRRTEFWARERDAAFSILATRAVHQRDWVMTGSWAGASGHAQFMPTTYQRFAIDHDGCGFADIWASPIDALASAANYLGAEGYQPPAPWGAHVKVTSEFDWAHYADARLDLATWREAGVRFPDALRAVACLYRLLAPEGASGPLFLVSRNFDALLQYNNAVSYALSVGLLADAIAGRAQRPLGLSWRDPEDALSLAEKQRLQTLLNAMGWDTGGVDGILGRKSREALRAYQVSMGFVPDGYADRQLFHRLSEAL